MSFRFSSSRKTSPTNQRNTIQKGIVISLTAAGGMLLLSLVATGATWRAIAYAMVALFGFLVILAAYFWTTMLFGSLAFVLNRRHTSVPWKIDGELAAQEYDIDPGLELVAAGMLVYQLGEIKPSMHFRQVPLANARAIRPFIVARTGAAKPYDFTFELSDNSDHIHFAEAFYSDLEPQPQIVTPCVRLLINDTLKTLDGQRWTLQVRSGLTVITSFRFTFTGGNGTHTAAGDHLPDDQQRYMSRLLDRALQQDVVFSPRNVILLED